MTKAKTRKDQTSTSRRLSAAPETVSASEQQQQLVQRTLADPSRAGSSQVLALQRVAGNAATVALLSPVNRVVQRVELDDVDTGTNVLDQATSVGGGITNIGTNAWWQTNASGNPQQLGTAGTGEATSILGMTSIYETIRSGAQLHGSRKKFQEVRTDKDRRDVKRVRSRNVNKGWGDTTQNTGNAVGSVSGVVTGGFSIAGSLSTASNVAQTAGNVAGVVGSSIALPINIFNLVRSSRRADLQRQRVNRIESTAKAIQHGTTEVDPSEVERLADKPRKKAEKLKKAAEKNVEDTKQAIGDLEKQKSTAELELKTRESRLSELTTKMSEAEVGLAELERRAQRARATGRSTGVTTERLAAERQALSNLRDEKAKAQRAMDRQQKRVAGFTTSIEEQKGLLTGYENDVVTHESEIQDAEKTNGSEVKRAQTVQDQMKGTGRLKATGENDGVLPSLKEIADYSTKKNKRGFARRTIGAVAAGVGVAAGAIGVASAVESLKNSSQLAANLGIAGAVLGGVAALGGLAVAAWKINSWRKKRKSQATKMAAQTGKQPSFGETYKVFGKKSVDHTTKRKHYATALVSYATHGTPEQRAEAWKIMAALDPKGPWAQKSSKPGQELRGVRSTITPGDRDELVSHFMDKMASGG